MSTAPPPPPMGAGSGGSGSNSSDSSARSNGSNAYSAALRPSAFELATVQQLEQMLPRLAAQLLLRLLRLMRVGGSRRRRLATGLAVALTAAAQLWALRSGRASLAEHVFGLRRQSLRVPAKQQPALSLQLLQALAMAAAPVLLDIMQAELLVADGVPDASTAAAATAPGAPVLVVSEAAATDHAGPAGRPQTQSTGSLPSTQQAEVSASHQRLRVQSQNPEPTIASGQQREADADADNEDGRDGGSSGGSATSHSSDTGSEVTTTTTTTATGTTQGTTATASHVFLTPQPATARLSATAQRRRRLGRTVIGALLALDVGQLLTYTLLFSQQSSLGLHLSGEAVVRPPWTDTSFHDRYAEEMQRRADLQLYRQVGYFRRFLLLVSGWALNVGKLVWPAAAMLITVALTLAESPAPPRKRINVEISPPAMPQALGAAGAGCARDSSCPFCGSKPARRPAVMPLAGIVACRACWQSRLDHDKCCPYTGLPAAASDLRNLFVDER